jgi:putative Holliday junction resolvase
MPSQHPDPRRPRKLLALDPGARRTGVAVSDELGLFAHPRPAIAAASQPALVSEVERLVAAEGVDEVVVGVPLGLHGGETPQTRAARDLANALRLRLAVRVTEWDERLSTVEASRYVRGRQHRQSGALDSAAAAIVLQSLIESRKGAAP